MENRQVWDIPDKKDSVIINGWLVGVEFNAPLDII